MFCLYCGSFSNSSRNMKRKTRFHAWRKRQQFFWNNWILVCCLDPLAARVQSLSCHAYHHIGQQRKRPLAFTSIYLVVTLAGYFLARWYQWAWPLPATHAFVYYSFECEFFFLSWVAEHVEEELWDAGHPMELCATQMKLALSVIDSFVPVCMLRVCIMMAQWLKW